MKQKITCFCDNSFDIEVPDEIDLDSNGGCYDEIQNGTFMNFICPGCGKKHKPEFPLTILWPSRKIRFEVIPETERSAFYRRKKKAAEKKSLLGETLIGYPEMADRLAVIHDGLEPLAVEAIKYYLHLKAEEQYTEREITIWYYGSGTDGILEFHIHGIKADEVASMKVPLSLYNKTLDDYKKRPKNALFTALRIRNYLSVRNTMIPEAFK